MHASGFLIFNGIIVLLIILRIFLDRKSPWPTINNDSKESRVTQNSQTEQNSTGERALNCVFMYNGHSFDAFEVLGIPAGSDAVACQKAFSELETGRKHPDDFMFELRETLKKNSLLNH